MTTAVAKRGGENVTATAVEADGGGGGGCPGGRDGAESEVAGDVVGRGAIRGAGGRGCRKGESRRHLPFWQKWWWRGQRTGEGAQSHEGRDLQKPGTEHFEQR